MFGKNPLYRPWALLTVGLLFSIGWGIRGNFGHETGAMFPGVLGGLGACLLSQRQDWHRRVIFFTLFGMLGWAFGGSISYMMVIGYTHSGHASTQWFGYAGLFFIGFLWAALGGGSTSIPAVLSADQLRQFLKPLACVLFAWTLLYFGLEPIQQRLEIWLTGSTAYDSMSRQEHPLYWLDTDWIQVSCIMLVLLAYQLYQQQFRKVGWLVTFAAVGGLVCYVVFFLVAQSVGDDWFRRLLVQYQGELSDGPYHRDELAVANWPQWFLTLAQRPGLLYQGDVLSLWGGALLGATVFFWRFGEFDFSTRLLTGMALGWWIAFLLLPVLGSLFLAEYGGLRMTPPRGDNWAGILGTLLAALVICWRAKQQAIVVAALMCGLWGGIGFSGIALLEAMLVRPGNPVLDAPPEIWKEWQETDWLAKTGDSRLSLPDLSSYPMAPAWQHYHQQNWHSFLEQGYGFVNGLGVAVALGVLVRRLPQLDDDHAWARRWENWALLYVLPVLFYANMVKNVPELTNGGEPGGLLPIRMRPPWIDMEIPFTVGAWFNLFFAVTTLALMVLLGMRGRRPIALLPESWLGRGQLLTLFILWTFIAGNFIHALPGFAEGRMLTEGIIYLHAVLVSILLLSIEEPSGAPELAGSVSWNRVAAVVLAVVVVSAVGVPWAEWTTMRHAYGDAQTGKRGLDFRFGPNANWHRVPMLRNMKHR